MHHRTEQQLQGMKKWIFPITSLRIVTNLSLDSIKLCLGSLKHLCGQSLPVNMRCQRASAVSLTVVFVHPALLFYLIFNEGCFFLKLLFSQTQQFLPFLLVKASLSNNWNSFSGYSNSDRKQSCMNRWELRRQVLVASGTTELMKII